MAQAVCMEDPTQRLVGGRARAVGTKNMFVMSVTLDVSKLSGWLNLHALCQVERAAWRGATCGPGDERAWGGGDTTSAQGGPSLLGGARAERTPNIHVMRVTLDVSKLTGWLNLYGLCELKGQHGERGDMRGRATRGRGAAAVQPVRREDLAAEVAVAGHARSAP